MKKSNLCALAILLSAPSFSAYSEEWSRDVTISQITFNASERPSNIGQQDLIFVDVSAAPWGTCNSTIVSIKESSSLISGLLMAYSAGMSITMTVDDSIVVPGTNRCQLTQINVRK